jgi:hypothetical protein
LAIVNSAGVINMSVQVSLLYVNFIPSMQGHMVGLLLVFLRNLHTDFHSGYISLDSHWQYIRVPFSTHPSQHLLFISLSLSAGGGTGGFEFRDLSLLGRLSTTWTGTTLPAQDWGFELGFTLIMQVLYCLSHTSSSPFYSGYFWRWGLTNYLPSPGWPWTVILPISASQAFRITGLSHPAYS